MTGRPSTSSRDHPKSTSDWRFHSVRTPRASVSTKASRAMSSTCSIRERRPTHHQLAVSTAPSAAEMSTIRSLTWTPVLSSVSCGLGAPLAPGDERLPTGARPVEGGGRAGRAIVLQLCFLWSMKRM